MAAYTMAALSRRSDASDERLMNFEKARQDFRLCPAGLPLADQLFMPPNGAQSTSFVNAHFAATAPASQQLKKGTTTLAFIYEPATDKDEGGVVVAVDSRASSGAYIGSGTVMKILDVADRMVSTMAGGAADCQFWVRVLAQYCSMYELREKEPISVAAASKYLSNVLYNYRGMGLSIGSLIAGYDKTGPVLYNIDSEGTRVRGKLFSVGSGSLYAMGVLDTFYKPKMTDAEALELGRNAIMYATYRDIGSGGNCNVCHITASGKTRYDPVDVSEMFYEYMDKERGRPVAIEPIIQ